MLLKYILIYILILSLRPFQANLVYRGSRSTIPAGGGILNSRSCFRLFDPLEAAVAAHRSAAPSPHKISLLVMLCKASLKWTRFRRNSHINAKQRLKHQCVFLVLFLFFWGGGASENVLMDQSGAQRRKIGNHCCKHCKRTTFNCRIQSSHKSTLFELDPEKTSSWNNSTNCVVAWGSWPWKELLLGLFLLKYPPHLTSLSFLCCTSRITLKLLLLVAKRNPPTQ